MFTRDEAQKLAQKVIGLSTFPECQVNINGSEQAYTRFANNGITTASFGLRQTVSVSGDARWTDRLLRGERSGRRLAAEAVKKAEELAAIAPPNPERLPPLGPQKYPAGERFRRAHGDSARSPEMIPHVKTIIDVAAEAEAGGGGADRARASRERRSRIRRGCSASTNAADSQLTTTIRMADGSSSGWAGQPSTKLAEHR